MKHYTRGMARESDRKAGSGDDRPAVSHNLFLALMPDAVTRERIAATVARLRSQQPSLGRWLGPERYHITLQFLGHHRPLPEALVDRVRDAASRVRQPAFGLVLDRTGQFPGARVGWLGCGTPPSALLALHAALREALVHADVPLEEAGRFIPHVTVLRNLRGRMPAMSTDPIAWDARGFVLVDSRHGDRVEYHEVGRWALG